MDSHAQSFSIPIAKREKFAVLREYILARKQVTLKTLQRYMGKCAFFAMCVPGGRLYTRSMARAVSLAHRNSRLVVLTQDLKDEICHWEFIDTCAEWLPWRREAHIPLQIITDSSGFAWAGVTPVGTMRDYWPRDDSRPIHLKEAEALVKTLQCILDQIKNSRVDALVDNQAVIKAWENEGGKDPKLNSYIKTLFTLSQQHNFQLRLSYIPSKSNVADEPSRELTLSDSMLSPSSWHQVESWYGPHTFDLMALDSNAMVGVKGKPLPHFTPFKLPLSTGVNVFSQKLQPGENYYVFPPFCLIAPLLRFLLQEVARPLYCTMILPRLSPMTSWWPFLMANAAHLRCLATRGCQTAVLVPSKKGFVSSQGGLPYDLYVARLLLK